MYYKNLLNYIVINVTSTYCLTDVQSYKRTIALDLKDDWQSTQLIYNEWENYTPYLAVFF